MLALIATLLLGQPRTQPQRFLEPNCQGGTRLSAQQLCVAAPYQTTFSVAPDCTCPTSVVAGTFGETITNQRDGGAFCTIGDWLNGIPTGNLVWCPSDSIRWMSGDGTTSGALSELATHNYSGPGNTGIRSQDFTNSPWANIGTGPMAAPIISPPDAGLCPDGTNTATRIQIPSNAIDVAQQSIVYNLSGAQGGGVLGSFSLYVRGYATDGGTDLTLDSTIVRAPYSVNSWTRGINEAVTMSTAAVSIGNKGYYRSPQVAEPAQDFLACFAQGETSPYVTSYTPGDRDADRIISNVMMPLQSDMHMSGTVLPEGLAVAAQATVGYDDATWLGAETQDDGGLHCRSVWSRVDEYVPDAGGWLGVWGKRTPFTFVCGWEPIPAEYFGGTPQELWSGVVDACLNNSCVDGGLTHNPLQTISGNSERVEFGGHLNNVDFNSQPNAIIKNLSFSSSAHKSIFLYGDSIVGGAQPQEVIHNTVWNLRGAADSVQNHAQSGHTIEQCQTDWNATMAAVRAHPQVACSTYMMVQCGTNSPDDAGYVLGILEGMLLDGQDAGVQVCGSTITPRDDHCPFVLAVNAGLRAFGAAHGIPIAETFNTALLGVDDGGCAENPTYYVDGVHPNDAGTLIETNVWIPTCGW